MTTREDRERAWRYHFGAENPDGDNEIWILHGRGDVARVLRTAADAFAAHREAERGRIAKMADAEASFGESQGDASYETTTAFRAFAVKIRSGR